MNNITDKCIRKFRNKCILRFKNRKWYWWLYPSFWHSKYIHEKSNQDGKAYLTAGLNSGAGIGHQMGFWFDGYWLADKWGIEYAHKDFFINGQHVEPDDRLIVFQLGKLKIYNTSGAWNKLLRLGIGEKSVNELREQGYKIRMLPLFDPYNEGEVSAVRQIIKSYHHDKIIFQLEVDQGSDVELNYIPIFREIFWKNRKKDSLLYCQNDFNIAIHIRRGDVNQTIDNGGRYNGNLYYVTALKTAYSLISDEQYKNRKIYVFSEGNEEDFPEFQGKEKVILCISESAKEAFLHFAYADLTIVSKSGFSCFGAMLNDGLKLYQKGMYFRVPDDEKWISLDENGRLWKDMGKIE